LIRRVPKILRDLSIIVAGKLTVPNLAICFRRTIETREHRRHG
jgi:hypothetical protein